MTDRPGLLARLLDLVDEATRPGTYPPPADLLARLRDAGTALADAEFITLAHEVGLGLPIASAAAALGGLPTGPTPAELAEVDEAWGLGGATRRRKATPAPLPAARAVVEPPPARPSSAPSDGPRRVVRKAR